MKIALCLSGQPRSYKEGFEYHKKNLLDHYDVDVYMHTWSYISPEVLADLVDLYGENGKRKAVIQTTKVEETTLEKIDRDFTNIPSPSFPARNTWLMWYSIYLSILMADHHGEEYNYDVIVRSRYDYALNIVPALKDTKVNTIYVPSDRMTPEHDFCADMFAWGTNIVMKKYGHTFRHMNDHYRTGTLYIGEDMLAAQLRDEGLIGKNMVYVNMNNPFPPGPYNFNTHSFLREDFKEWNPYR